MISVSEESHKTIIRIVADIQNEVTERVYVHNAVDELCDFYNKNHKGDRE